MESRSLRGSVVGMVAWLGRMKKGFHLLLWGGIWVLLGTPAYLAADVPDHYDVVASPFDRDVGQVTTLTITAKDDFDVAIGGAAVMTLDITQFGSDSFGFTYSNLVDDSGGSSLLTDNFDGTATITDTVFDSSGQITLDVQLDTLNQEDEGEELNFDLVTFIATDENSATGNTFDSFTDVQWNVGSIADFDVLANPANLTAGEFSEVTVCARDSFGNAIHDHSTGSGITVTPSTSGEGASYLSRTLAAGDVGDGTGFIDSDQLFDSGCGSIQVKNTVAEAATFTFLDADTGTITGSAEITWNPGSLQNFLVEANPVDRVVGEAATITLTARDALNNAIPDEFVSQIDVSQSGGDSAGYTFDNLVDAGGGSVLTDNFDGTATITNTVFDAGGQIAFDVF